MAFLFGITGAAAARTEQAHGFPIGSDEGGSSSGGGKEEAGEGGDAGAPAVPQVISERETRREKLVD